MKTWLSTWGLTPQAARERTRIWHSTSVRCVMPGRTTRSSCPANLDRARGEGIAGAVLESCRFSRATEASEDCSRRQVEALLAHARSLGGRGKMLPTGFKQLWVCVEKACVLCGVSMRVCGMCGMCVACVCVARVVRAGPLRVCVHLRERQRHLPSNIVSVSECPQTANGACMCMETSHRNVSCHTKCTIFLKSFMPLLSFV